MEIPLRLPRPRVGSRGNLQHPISGNLGHCQASVPIRCTAFLLSQSLSHPTMLNSTLRRTLILGLHAATLLGLPLLAPTTLAQDTPADVPIIEVDPLLRLWGRNVARQVAEGANGGLMNYRAESAMHALPAEAPYGVAEDGSLIFTFRGYTPGNQDANGDPIYTVETTVVIYPDRTYELLYNGPVR